MALAMDDCCILLFASYMNYEKCNKSICDDLAESLPEKLVCLASINETMKLKSTFKLIS